MDTVGSNNGQPAVTGQLRNLDRALALSRVGGDEELLQEIAQLFLEDEPRMLAAIESAIHAADLHALERAAHTLKGCVSNFGAEAAFEASLSLERIARERNAEAVPEAYSKLRAHLHELEPELQSLLPG